MEAWGYFPTPTQREAWKWNLPSSMRTSEKCSGWHWRVPPHSSDGLSCSQGSFVTVRQVAQHPHLPGQGGGKQQSNQEASPFSLPAQLCWGDGSGKQHLHESAAGLKLSVSCGLWCLCPGEEEKKKMNKQCEIKCLYLNRICTEVCSRPWRRQWLSWESITSGTSV